MYDLAGNVKPDNMDQGFNWDNLEQNRITALKYICQQNHIYVQGNAKKDYINAVALYRRSKLQNSSPPRPQNLPSPMSPELQTLVHPSSRSNNFSSLHHARSTRQFHEDANRLLSTFTRNSTRSDRKVPPPTPPKPIHRSHPRSHPAKLEELVPKSPPSPPPPRSDSPERKVDFAPLPEMPSHHSSRAPSPVMKSEPQLVLTMSSVTWIIAVLLFIIVLLLVLILCIV